MSNEGKFDEKEYKREVETLITLCENGNYQYVKKIFTKYQFPECIVYECIRKCFNKYEESKVESVDTMKELFAHINCNYKRNSESSDGKTILMILCEKGDYGLVEIFLKQAKQIIFLNDKDKSDKNVFHHLFIKRYKVEDFVVKIFDLLLSYYDHTQKSQKENIKAILREVDNEGKIPLNYILLNGWNKALDRYSKIAELSNYIIPIEQNVCLI